MIDCHNSYIKYLTKQMTNIVLYLYIVQSLWVIYIYINNNKHCCLIHIIRGLFMKKRDLNCQF